MDTININVLRGEGLARQQMLAQTIGEVVAQEAYRLPEPKQGSLAARLAIAQAGAN